MTSRSSGGWIYNMVDSYTSIGLKAMLTTSAFTFNPSTHWYRNQVTNEITSANYIQGGVEVTGVSVVTGTDEVLIKADNVFFGVLSVPNVARIVFYLDTGTAATDSIISCHEFPAVTVNTTQFTYTLPSGVLGSFKY